LRIGLSVATLVLLIFGDGARLPFDLRIVLGLVAVLSLLTTPSWRRLSSRQNAMIRIAFDTILALTIVFAFTGPASPLAWIALLVPVIEAATISTAFAVATWFGVSFLYTSLRIGLPGSDDVSFVVGLQQLLSVGIVGVPLAHWSHRTSSSLRAAAREKRLAGRHAYSLRRVGEFVSGLTRARTADDVDTIALDARVALGAQRAELLEKDVDGRWRLISAAGTSLKRHAEVLLDGATDGSGPVLPTGPSDANQIQLAGYRLAVAVSLGDKRDAVWRLWFEERTLDSHDHETLDLLSSAIRQAYQSVAEFDRLRSWSKELERRANVDALTGVLNRRGLQLALEHESWPLLAALYLDLNNFKPINDEHGHGVGDYVLQIVVRRFESCLPPEALLARVGGDEFAIVVGFEQSQEDIDVYLDDLRRELEHSLADPVAHKQRKLTVSVSVGISRGEAEAELDELLRQADIEMYQRKRTLTAQESVPPADQDV